MQQTQPVTERAIRPKIHTPDRSWGRQRMSVAEVTVNPCDFRSQTTLPAIADCKLIRPPLFADERGTFVKSFNAETFRLAGLPTHWAETYHSKSRRGVIRGLHLQRKPAELGKLVWCVAGHIWDVVLDLRGTSPTCGMYAAFELSPEEPMAIYVPPGCAHGFCALDDNSIVVYQTTSTHSPADDVGVRWDSAGINWPIRNPIVSERDNRLPSLSQFVSLGS
jgi:dTDP-4-dehydrorhamnose 3,5-epimerase